MDACHWQQLFDRLDGAEHVQAALATLIQPDECPWVRTMFPEEVQAVIDAVASRFSVPASDVQIVGSGRFGRSMLTLRPFEPGRSDLDVAVIDAAGFERHAVEWSRARPSALHPYVAAGILRPDLFSDAPWSREWQIWTDALGRLHGQAFGEITVTMYRSLEDLRVKQQYALYRLGMARALAAQRSGFPSSSSRADIDRDGARDGLQAAEAIDVVATLIGAAPRQVRLIRACMSPGAPRVTCRYELMPAVLPGQHFQSLRAIRDTFAVCGLTLQLIPDNARDWSRVARIGGLGAA